MPEPLGNDPDGHTPLKEMGAVTVAQIVQRAPPRQPELSREWIAVPLADVIVVERLPTGQAEDEIERVPAPASHTPTFLCVAAQSALVRGLLLPRPKPT